MGIGPLSILSTLGVFAPLKGSIGPAFEAEAGCRLALAFDPTSVLLDAVAAGRRADVLVAIDTGVGRLVSEGILSGDSVRDVARTVVGLAKRPGTPPVDISTPEQFVEVLRCAKSIVFSQSGASGILFAKLIEDLGIAQEIRAKAVIVHKGFTAEAMVAGQADLAVQQMSELAAVPGVELIGPFPTPYRVETTFTAAAFAQSGRHAQAHAFIAHLAGGGSAAALNGAGLEAVWGGRAPA